MKDPKGNPNEPALAPSVKSRTVCGLTSAEVKEYFGYLMSNKTYKRGRVRGKEQQLLRKVRAYFTKIKHASMMSMGDRIKEIHRREKEVESQQKGS